MLQLLHCEKDLREVTSVRDFLIRVLGPACEEVKHSAPFVLQLRHVQHICVPFSAKMSAASNRDEHEHVRPLALDAVAHAPPEDAAPQQLASPQ